MAKEIWFCSDLHLGHENMYKFTNYDGTKCRPWDNYVEAEEYMLQEFNKLIKSEDTLYCLGDVCSQTSRATYFFNNLNPCRRILLMGNHDNKVGFKFLSKYFDEIRGAYNLENYIMTHIPICSGSKGRFKTNIHGHCHNNIITINNDNVTPDPWYYNVCVERTDYKPISFSVIKEHTEKAIEDGLIKIPQKGDRII